MSLITVLKNFLSGAQFSKLDDDQEEALVDTLTYVMAVDGELSDAEEQQLSEALDVLDWDRGTSIDSYVHDSIERAKQKAATVEETRQYCLELSERLGEDWLREETYYLAARMAAADAEIVDDEHGVLKTIVDTFGIDDRTQGRITDQIMREVDFK